MTIEYGHALDGLSRAELRLLIERFVPAIGPREIALARWAVAADDWKTASERIDRIRDARTLAREAHMARPKSIKLLGVYQEANLALERAELAASRAWSRYRRLYDELQALDREDAA